MHLRVLIVIGCTILFMILVLQLFVNVSRYDVSSYETFETLKESIYIDQNVWDLNLLIDYSRLKLTPTTTFRDAVYAVTDMFFFNTHLKHMFSLCHVYENCLAHYVLATNVNYKGASNESNNKIDHPKNYMSIIKPHDTIFILGDFVTLQTITKQILFLHKKESDTIKFEPIQTLDEIKFKDGHLATLVSTENGMTNRIEATHLRIIDYSIEDPHLIKFMFPFAFMETKDINSLVTMPTKGFVKVLSTHIGFGSRNINGLKVDHVRTNLEWLAFYSIHFTVCKALSIEGFSNKSVDPIDVEIKSSITAQLLRIDRTIFKEIRVSKRPLEVQKVSLAVGDSISIKNQKNHHLNGKYQIAQLHDSPFEMVLVTATPLKFSDITMNKVVRRHILLDTVNTNFFRNTKPLDIRLEYLDKVYFEDIRYGAVVSEIIEPGLYEFLLYNDQSNDVNEYECVGISTIFTQDVCETKGHVWDKRCESNDECPFYMANKNYPNSRGGCIDGYCEMPLGVERLGYTKFTTDADAFCHRCHDVTKPTCCDEQKKTTSYPQLLTPDYAFKGDEFERHNQVQLNS